MNLISLQNSWNIIENTINSILKREQENSYYLTKLKLLENGPYGNIYIDQFDYHTDSIDSIGYGYYSGKKVNLVFDNTSVKIKPYTFASNNTNINNIIFKFQSNELNNLEIDDMLSLVQSSNYIIVPEGTKQAYIDKFDNTVDSFNQWGRLTQEEKEAKVIEGDEFTETEEVTI